MIDKKTSQGRRAYRYNTGSRPAVLMALLVRQRVRMIKGSREGRKEEVWYAVHCDDFKRRVEYPGRLRCCGAHHKNENG